MTLIIGIGQSFIDQYFLLLKMMFPDLNSLIVLLLASIVLLVLTNSYHYLLSGVVGGASLQGIGGFGAGMITGAATTAISGAGAMAMGASAQVSGGASALKGSVRVCASCHGRKNLVQAVGGGSGGVFGGGEDTGSVDTSGGQTLRRFRWFRLLGAVQVAPEEVRVCFILTSWPHGKPYGKQHG